MAPTMSDAAELFKALGDETRLKIVKMIAAKGNTLCVGALSKYIGISQPAVSQHLKVLKNAGLVNPVKTGAFVHYSLALDSMNSYGVQLKSFLESFGAEFKLDEICDHKGTEEKCRDLN